MGNLDDQAKRTIYSNSLARRNFFIRPPEPPEDLLMGDPANSIYVGRTKIFHVPFHWSYKNVTNPHIAIVGISGAGKTISSSEEVLIRQNGMQKLVEIGEIVERLIEENGEVKIDEDFTGVLNPAIDVFTFDKKLNGRWGRVLVAAKKKAPEKLYEVKTKSGRKITTTGDHNGIIIKQGTIRVAKTSELKPGDNIPLPRRLSFTGEVSEINLLDYLRGEGLYVNGAERLLNENWNAIKESKPFGELDKYLPKYKRGVLMPLKYFFKLLEKTGIILTDRDLFELKIIASNGGKALPVRFKVTSAFARLLGYIVSEGHIGKNRVQVSNLDERIKQEVAKACSELGLKTTISDRFVNIHSIVFTELIRSLGAHGKSGEKRVPEIVFSFNDELASAYLKAYYEGDGGVDGNEVSATTKSEKLASDHAYILLRFGIVARMHKTWKRATNAMHAGDWYYKVSVSGKENLEAFRDKIGFVTNEKNKRLSALISESGSGNTNVDVIPEIDGLVNKIYGALHFERSQASYSISKALRRPSRKVLSEVVGRMEKRVSELKSLQRTIDRLRSVPRLSDVINAGKRSESLNHLLYEELDESWRRAKLGLVSTRAAVGFRIAEITEEKSHNFDDVRENLNTALRTLGVGYHAFDKQLSGRMHSGKYNPAYSKIEQAIAFAVKKYETIFAELPEIEQDIEFLRFLASSDLFWDEIVEIKEINCADKWVYDLMVENEVFLAGKGGMFVHNSYFVKTFLTRASFVWGANAFIIDWAGEYKDWVKQTGGKVISLGKGSYINLLDLAGMKPIDRVKQVVRTLEILTDLGQYPEQRRLTELAIDESYNRKGFRMADKSQRDALGNLLIPPTLKDAQKILEERLDAGTYEFPAELENAIFRVKKFTREGEDFFAEQSTVKLEELTSIGLVDLDLSGLPDEVFRGLAALSMLQFLKEKMREEGWSPTKGLKLLVILDEAWKIAKEENSDAVMIVREGRKYQFGLIVASQNPTDISEAIFSNVGTTFILRIKFERYMDYIQNSLNFSGFMRESISRFGVGECAVNMAFQTASPFSETFLLDRIDGEEPLVEYFLDIESVLGPKMGVGDLAKTYSFERTELKRKLRGFGLSDANVEEITGLFDKKNRHLDVINFVILLEKYGIARSNITLFLKDVGLEDSTIINVFGKSDQKKLGMEDKDITEVILKEEPKKK